MSSQAKLTSKSLKIKKDYQRVIMAKPNKQWSQDGETELKKKS